MIVRRERPSAADRRARQGIDYARPVRCAWILLIAAGCRVSFDRRDDARRDDARRDDAFVDPIGCADGQREGFVDMTKFPSIAGCAATWLARPSMRATRTLCFSRRIESFPRSGVAQSKPAEQRAGFIRSRGAIRQCIYQVLLRFFGRATVTSQRCGGSLLDYSPSWIAIVRFRRSRCAGFGTSNGANHGGSRRDIPPFPALPRVACSQRRGRRRPDMGKH